MFDTMRMHAGLADAAVVNRVLVMSILVMALSVYGLCGPLHTEHADASGIPRVPHGAGLGNGMQSAHADHHSAPRPGASGVAYEQCCGDMAPLAAVLSRTPKPPTVAFTAELATVPAAFPRLNSAAGAGPLARYRRDPAPTATTVPLAIPLRL